MDYLGIGAELRAALAEYNARDCEQVKLDVEEAVRQTLTRLLTRTIRGSAKLDWTRKGSVRAKMRIEVRKLLARYGYPPDLQRAAVDLVIEQAETLLRSWF